MGIVVDKVGPGKFSEFSGFLWQFSFQTTAPFPLIIPSLMPYRADTDSIIE
jgi:hypothetical protein